jgi:Fur family ferric uptake transcriptional regulator
MDQKTQLYERLREKGQRITPQKRAILDVLLDNPGRMLSVSEICARLPKGSGIDDATVYRNVRGFVEPGLLESMIDLKGHSRYMICDCVHHHHFICTDCGRIINFPCNNPFWRGIARQHNFKESGHRIEVFGLCADCQNT